MCLILLKPPQVQLTEGIFKNVFTRNKDGFGYMYLNHKNIPVFEKFVPKKWEEAWEAYQPHQNKHIALHWRFKTHGKVIQENAHPYVVKENEILMMHNGTIPGHYDADKSDTLMFVENTLAPMLDLYGRKCYDALKHDAFRRVVGGYIGSSSRLLFLTKQGFTGINDFIKADDGYVEAIQGILFSNTYAWDNQYWFKNAHENEYNKGLVPSWRDRISHTPYSSRYNGSYPDYLRNKENGTKEKEQETTETTSETTTSNTSNTRKEGKKESDNGRHRGHANPHADIVRPISQHTLHLPKDRKSKAARIAQQLREAAAEKTTAKLLSKSIQRTLDNIEPKKNEEDTSQPETTLIAGQPVLLVKPHKLSAEQINVIAERGAVATALLVDKTIVLPDNAGSHLHH